MRSHRLTRASPHTAGQMFALAADVERYPDFVPWVTSMRTWNLRAGEGEADQLDAEAAVGFSFFRERFATRVFRDPAALTVSTKLISGPFKALEAEWSFKPATGGCDIGFQIEFEFRSRLLGAVLDANFDRAVGRLIDCFERRADALYGAP